MCKEARLLTDAPPPRPYLSEPGQLHTPGACTRVGAFWRAVASSEHWLATPPGRLFRVLARHPHV